MTRCPECGAHREESDDYCPVCGETFSGPMLSEATGPRWYTRTGVLVVLTLLIWPVALMGLYQRDAWDRSVDQWLLLGCLVMAVVWVLLLA